MNTAFESIKKGLAEAIKYFEGKPIKAKVYKPKKIDVKEIRKASNNENRKS
ncbi:hypothetical protein H8E88_31895 [candidate division KSB1 bacterium]|nr:hypothetical protein [candidate division KSB1 bacterium]MBL7092687.1 hypothetical protein [candidate division KSB1 bacterium]